MALALQPVGNELAVQLKISVLDAASARNPLGTWEIESTSDLSFLGAAPAGPASTPTIATASTARPNHFTVHLRPPAVPGPFPRW